MAFATDFQKESSCLDDHKIGPKLSFDHFFICTMCSSAKHDGCIATDQIAVAVAHIYLLWASLAVTESWLLAGADSKSKS
jgi:hypothetical protein